MQKLFIVMLLLLSFKQVKAQNADLKVISSTGGSAQLGSITLDWTVGEIATSSIQNTATLITQGFHQPKLKLTAIEELGAEIGTIKVYPNPTSDFLKMDLAFDRYRSVKVEMFDAAGRSVRSARMTGRLVAESINTHDLPAGNYFLYFLIDGNRFRKAFKVQKLN